jgi:hypothetical protein
VFWRPEGERRSATVAKAWKLQHSMYGTSVRGWKIA